TPVFPSVTYPGHASIVTGVRPARHGIFFNVIWGPIDGPSRWYEEAADLRATPLWEIARAGGLTTAAVSWPSTLGARIDWLGPEVRPGVARIDAHVGALVAALRAAGIVADTTVIVTGDHGFQDVERTVELNQILAQAGLGGCRSARAEWRATAYVTGGSAAIFVRGPADAAAAEAALRREARDRYAIVSRRQLDGVEAMTGA